jgi:hypothetical protein
MLRTTPKSRPRSAVPPRKPVLAPPAAEVPRTTTMTDTAFVIEPSRQHAVLFMVQVVWYFGSFAALSYYFDGRHLRGSLIAGAVFASLSVVLAVGIAVVRRRIARQAG